MSEQKRVSCLKGTSRASAPLKFSSSGRKVVEALDVERNVDVVAFTDKTSVCVEVLIAVVVRVVLVDVDVVKATGST